MKCISVFIFLAVLIAGAKGAQTISEQAMDFARKAQYAQALPLFQQVLKSETTAENWNNVGVTHMRMGHYVDAYQAFSNGRALAGGRRTDNDANLDVLASLQPNIKQLIKSQRSIYADGKLDFITRPAKKVMAPEAAFKHVRNRLPRIPMSRFYAKEYIKYNRGLAPFVLTGLFDTPTFRNKSVDAREAWTLEHFESQWGEVLVDYYPHNMDTSRVKPMIMPMKAAIADLRGGDAAYPRSLSNQGRYIQWNMDAASWRRFRLGLGDIPTLFESDEPWLQSCLGCATCEPGPGRHTLQNEFMKMTHWRMMLIGNEDAGMFNHKDTLHTSSFQIQIAGSKRWHICAPSQEPYLYDAGDVDTFNPDYDRFPNFKNANCFDDVVTAGEAIYYPRDYWHQTNNLATPTISISSALVDLDNYPHVWEALEEELSGRRRTLIPASPELTHALRTRCFPTWNTTFGTHTGFPLDVQGTSLLDEITY